MRDAMPPTPDTSGKTARLGISGRIAAFFEAAQITPLLALVAFLLGLFAILVTPREEEPQIDVTMANVIIPFPGAAAKDVESLVATPAEQVLSQMTGVDLYSLSKSESRFNLLNNSNVFSNTVSALCDWFKIVAHSKYKD